jgi:hypothetical protein
VLECGVSPNSSYVATRPVFSCVVRLAPSPQRARAPVCARVRVRVCGFPAEHVDRAAACAPPSPKELRDKKLLHRTSISMQNVNGLGTDAKIREACQTVRENRIPCTTALEAHRCFDQCLEHGNITFLPWPRLGEPKSKN